MGRVSRYLWCKFRRTYSLVVVCWSPPTHTHGLPQPYNCLTLYAQVSMDSKNAKMQRRAHIVWDEGGPATALLVKKPNSRAASRMLKEIALWCE